MPPRKKNKIRIRENEGTPEEVAESDVEMAPVVEDDAQVVNNRGARNNPTRDAEPQVMEPPPPFDPKTFRHQPITAAHHQKMKTVSDAWNTPKNPLDALAQLVRESAVLLTEVAEDVDPTTIRMLDKTMREVVDMQSELDARKNAAIGLRERLTKGEVIADPVTIWEKDAHQDIDKYQQRTTRQKYANNKTYRDYKEEIWGVTHEGGMPPLKSMIPAEDGDDSDDDDDVEVGGMVVTFRDPITKGWLEDPVTSKKCHHSYSRASMYAYLPSARDVKKCPAAGCGENVSRADLEADENLARQVRNAQRREQEQERGKRNRKGAMVVDDSDDDIVE